MHDVAPRLPALLGLWLAASAWLRTYRDRADASVVGALLRVAEASVVFCTLAITVTFFLRQFGGDLSRSFVLILAPITFLCLVVSLGAAIKVAGEIQRRWPALNRVAVLGSEEEAGDVLTALRRASGQSVAFRGLILPERYAFEMAGGLASGLGGGSGVTNGSRRAPVWEPPATWRR